MDKIRTTFSWITLIIASTVIGGVTSFYLAGGIAMLASDVGIEGAWGLSVLIQFLYAGISIVGFLIVQFLSRNYPLFSPRLVPVIGGAVVISATINLYGVFVPGPVLGFLWLSLMIFAGSVVFYCIAMAMFNGHTRSSS